MSQPIETQSATSSSSDPIDTDATVSIEWKTAVFNQEMLDKHPESPMPKLIPVVREPLEVAAAAAAADAIKEPSPQPPEADVIIPETPEPEREHENENEYTEKPFNPNEYILNSSEEQLEPLSLPLHACVEQLFYKAPMFIVRVHVPLDFNSFNDRDNTKDNYSIAEPYMRGWHLQYPEFKVLCDRKTKAGPYTPKDVNIHVFKFDLNQKQNEAVELVELQSSTALALAVHKSLPLAVAKSSRKRLSAEATAAAAAASDSSESGESPTKKHNARIDWEAFYKHAMKCEDSQCFHTTIKVVHPPSEKQVRNMMNWTLDSMEKIMAEPDELESAPVCPQMSCTHDLQCMMPGGKCACPNAWPDKDSEDYGCCTCDWPSSDKPPPHKVRTRQVILQEREEKAKKQA